MLVGQRQGVRPLDLTPFPTELAIRWDNETESFIPFETLRRFCPCAGCMGEQDVMGNVYRAPEKPFAPNSFTLLRLDPVGGYGVQPVWADGHATGIYTWDYLHRLGESHRDGDRTTAGQ